MGLRLPVRLDGGRVIFRHTTVLFNSNSFAGPAALAEVCALPSAVLVSHFHWNVFMRDAYICTARPCCRKMAGWMSVTRRYCV